MSIARVALEGTGFVLLQDCLLPCSAITTAPFAWPSPGRLFLPFFLRTWLQSQLPRHSNICIIAFEWTGHFLPALGHEGIPKRVSVVDCSSDPLGWNLPSLSVRPSEARNPQVIKCTDIRNLDNILASVQQAIILSKSQQGGGVSLVIDSLSGIIQRHGKTAVCRFLAGLTKLCKYNEDRIKKDKCDSEDGGVVVALLHGDLHLGSDGMFRVNAVEYMANIIVRLVFSPSSVSQVETFEESSSTSPERDFTCYITNKKASGRVTRVVPLFI
jgi:hypothetical protein